MKITKNIIVFYHENCVDGFTGAFVAHKKFKEKAEYIPLSRTVKGDDILQSKKIKISELKDKEVYFIDFCLKENELKKVQKVAKKLIVIDHHIGMKRLVESLFGSVFRDGVSGAYLAHEYFFPKNIIPKLIRYISIGDTYSFSKDEKINKEERNILAYVYTLQFDFKIFSKVEKDLEDKKKFLEIKNTGTILQSNYLKLVDNQLNSAKLINFDGYKVYAINASPVFRNELGHKLTEKTKTFTIIYTFERGELKLSFRANGGVDVEKIAEKYGGGGHVNASSMKTKDVKFIDEFIKKIIS
ncbi:MAG: DHHA1 domain-containing protein [Candidatus Paceibacterota bacterium]